jgi:hypothetical protein
VKPCFVSLRSFGLVLCSALFMGSSQAASLSSSSQAACFDLAPVNSTSDSQPTASSSASCSESFSFSKSSASASGTASFGTLTAAGNAGDKDILTSFQTSESFADTLHLHGPAPSGGVDVQFFIQTQGSLTSESLVGSGPLFTLLFSDGETPLSVTETCPISCVFTNEYSFSQGYLVTVDDKNFSAISFSAALGLSAGEYAGSAGGFGVSAQLQSIMLVDPTTGLPISGLSYTTDSGTQYDLPEPGTFILLPIGVVFLGLLSYRKSLNQSR